MTDLKARPFTVSWVKDAFGIDPVDDNVDVFVHMQDSLATIKVPGRSRREASSPALQIRETRVPKR